MVKKDEILKQFALISDNLESLPFGSKKNEVLIYLKEFEFNEMFNLFSNKKITESDYVFSIYVDDVKFKILKIV